MLHNGLFIFVEGPDDARFVERILKPHLKNKYKWVETYQYSGTTPKKVSRFIQNVTKMKADYIFLTDLDSAPCITSKKNTTKNIYYTLDEDKIIIVKTEIEGWYLAGLPADLAKQWHLKSPKNTNHLTKEQFNHLIPKSFISRIAFMTELLNHYSTSNAQKQNQSFSYFSRKYLTFPP